MTAFVDGSPLRLLTNRELEVLRLLARGMTNRDIAQTLVISVRTADVHVSRILMKLGVARRGQASAKAVALGAVQPHELG